MTRLERAIEELRRAAGGRPFALVMDRCHEDAPGTHVVVEYPDDQPAYVTRGLLVTGDALMDRWSEQYDVAEGDEENED